MPTYYKLTQCYPYSYSFYTTTDLSIYAPGTVLSIGGLCVTFEEVPSPVTPPVLVIVDATFNSCNKCLYPCYNITSCNGTLGPISVLTDLSSYVGSTVSVNEYPGECFFVEGTADIFLCTDSITVTNIQPCDCNCYTLISCQPGLYPNLYLQSNTLLEPFVGQLININGDLTKKYTVEHSLQYVGLAPDNASVFCDPLSFPVNYKIISFIYNGSEYVITPYTYSTTTLNFQGLDCTGLSCVASTCPTVNNYINFADMLNGFFNTLTLPVRAYPYTDSGNRTQIAISYLAGDSFSLSVDYSGFGSGTFNYHAIFVVDSSGSPIRYYNGDPMVSYTPYIICAAPTTSYTSIAAATPCYSCYTLTNCNSSLIVNTLTDLSTYIGTTIEVTEYPGECFSVVGNLDVFLCTDTVPVTGMTPCSCTPGCGCPDGYVLLPDGVTCQQILTAPATQNPTIYAVQQAQQLAGYGVNGANIYEDISTKILPIKGVTGGSWKDDNGIGAALTFTNYLPSPNTFTVWQDRLRKVGVRPNPRPIPIDWTGLTCCITVPETKTYCIGFAFDDYIRISINGVLQIQRIPPGTSPLTYTVWHIMPLTLTAGTNNIQYEVNGFAPPDAIGFEIYDATPAQLALVTTEAQLTPYIKYSSESLLPPNPQAYFDIGGVSSGYTCPPGYTLSTCDGITCTQVLQTPVLPCCYALEDCSSGTTYVTSTDLSTYIGLTVNLNEIPGCLLVVGISPTCTGSLTVTVVSSFANCTSCEVVPPPCYTLTDNCTGGTGLSFTVTNDLSASVGSVIKVCPSDLPIPNPTPPNPGTPLVPFVPDDALFQYNLINCCDPLDVLIVTNTLYPYIGQTISVPVLGNKCWTVTEILLVGTSMGFIDLTGAYVYTDCGPCMGIFPCSVPYLPELLECRCLTITDSPFCDGAITLTTLGPISATCDECLPPPPICYELTDCQGVVDPFIVCDDLSGYIGSVIKIEGCGDTCWSVALADTCDNSICLNGAITSFISCLACLPPPPVPTPFALHARRIKPGYFSTNSCLTTEYIERVNCTFALEVYNQMIIKRYGVTVCCDNDLDQWDIKKQVLDFELLTDPALCKSTLNPFVPSCPDEPI